MCFLLFGGLVQQLGALQGKKDPEVKRKTIGAGFIEVFRDFAITLKTKHGIRPKYLVQVRRSSWLGGCPPALCEYSMTQW